LHGDKNPKSGKLLLPAQSSWSLQTAAGIAETCSFRCSIRQMLPLFLSAILCVVRICLVAPELPVFENIGASGACQLGETVQLEPECGGADRLHFASAPSSGFIAAAIRGFFVTVGIQAEE